MKNFVILLSLLMSCFAFAGCASKCTSETVQSPVVAAPIHQDFKGEVSK